MNFKKINLDLTIGLMNLTPNNTSLSSVKKLVSEVQEAGRFVGSQLVSKKEIGQGWQNSTYALKYENCTVNVDLAANRWAGEQVVKGFNIK